MEKPKTTKVVRIEATFPELPGGRCNQTGKGEGTSLKVAAKRALDDLLRQKKLKHQRFTTIKAIISIGTITEESSETETQRDQAQPLQESEAKSS